MAALMKLTAKIANYSINSTHSTYRGDETSISSLVSCSMKSARIVASLVLCKANGEATSPFPLKSNEPTVEDNWGIVYL